MFTDIVTVTQHRLILIMKYCEDTLVLHWDALVGTDK